MRYIEAYYVARTLSRRYFRKFSEKPYEADIVIYTKDSEAQIIMFSTLPVITQLAGNVTAKA